MLTLAQRFGSLNGLLQASMEELALCPGIGPTKVKRIHEALHEPFKRKAKAPAAGARAGAGAGAPRPATAAGGAGSRPTTSTAALGGSLGSGGDAGQVQAGWKCCFPDCPCPLWRPEEGGEPASAAEWGADESVAEKVRGILGGASKECLHCRRGVHTGCVARIGAPGRWEHIRSMPPEIYLCPDCCQ